MSDTDRTDPYAPSVKPWMRKWLWAAAIYNSVWGLGAIFAPTLAFEFIGLQPGDYPAMMPALWQCIGMIVGVYGVGYALAATDPRRHWPIVLVGLMGKIFGPIGYVWHASQGNLPWIGGLTIITNDLIWWVPFALTLRAAWTPEALRPAKAGELVHGALSASEDQDGRDLLSWSEQGPLLIVFLRHFGCTFCREALADVSRQREALAESNTQVALVHMSSDYEAERFFSRYDLQDVPRVSDPDRNLYQAFGLSRGKASQLFGLSVWRRGFKAGVLRGHGVGKLQGDGFQMPGAFLVRHGRIVRAYVHRSAADRPDYGELAGARVTPAEPAAA